MEASPQARYLGHWVKVINHDVTVKISRLLKPFGLTRSSWSVLYQVNGAGRISQKALQEDLGIESASMAIVVDGLVRKGWLDRTSSEKDRRANYLKLTPKGSHPEEVFGEPREEHQRLAEDEAAQSPVGD